MVAGAAARLGDVQRIFVGDVQGCADELGELVVRAEQAFGRDFELWLVGDTVNRGPASLRVLQQLRSLQEEERMHVVLGNHEVSLLRVAYGQRDCMPGDTFQDVLEAAGADSWLEWVRHWPLVDSGRLGTQDFAMVHASVAPGWSLATLEAHARRVEMRLRESRREAKRLLAARPADDPDADVLARLTRARSVGRARSVVESRARNTRRRVAPALVGRRSELRRRLRTLGDAGTSRCAQSPRTRHGLRLSRQVRRSRADGVVAAARRGDSVRGSG